MTTITYIAKPEDSRCQWFSFRLPSKIDAKYLEERMELPYLKKGADIELQNNEMILDSEQVHHRKARGYRVNLGMAIAGDGERGGKVFFLCPRLAHKLHIKSQEGCAHLTKGSGDVAACIRIAIYCQMQADPQAAFLALRDLK